MKLFNTTLIAAILVTGTHAFSVHNNKSNNNNNRGTPSSSASVDRRQAVAGVSAAVAAAVVTGGSLLVPEAANAAGEGAEAFVGTYTDPINHPGGTRTIVLLDSTAAVVGDYRLAEVRGGGGRGEPASYVLPAAVIGDRTIVIDFSPKGGPRDFVGILEKGDIRFLKDGNRWPRQN